MTPLWTVLNKLKNHLTVDWTTKLQLNTLNWPELNFKHIQNFNDNKQSINPKRSTQTQRTRDNDNNDDYTRITHIYHHRLIPAIYAKWSCKYRYRTDWKFKILYSLREVHSIGLISVALQSQVTCGVRLIWFCLLSGEVWWRWHCPSTTWAKVDDDFYRLDRFYDCVERFQTRFEC